MAGKTIKGLIVEIGGDTSKLGKALESVEKKSRDLSSELGQINKLLKLDPGNVELLAQKQKVLADAVSTTKEKLDKLKEAEKQVQQQFERGEVSEDQVRALQREIIATEKKMSTYEKAAKETADQIDQLGDDSEDTKKDIDKMGEEAEDAKKDLDDMGDKAEKSGKDLDEAGDKAKKFGDKAKKAGELAAKSFAAVGAAAGAALGALAKCSVEAAAYADEMLTLSTVTGISTENLQAYNYASELLDVSVETITKSQAKQIKSMKAVQDGTKLSVEAYQKLGVSVTNADGSLRDSETVYWEVIDSLGKMENETERDALAMQILGKSAQELNPLIEAGSEKMAELTQEAKEVGAVLSEEALAALGAFDDSLQRLKGSAGAAKNSLGAVLLPELQHLTDTGTGLLNDFTRTLNKSGGGLEGFIATIDEMSEELGTAMSDLVSFLLDKVTALAPSLAKVGLNFASTLAMSLLDSLPDLTSTLTSMASQAVSTVADLLPKLLPAIVESALSVTDRLLDSLPNLLSACVSLVQGVVNALPSILELLRDRLPELINTIIYGVLPAVVTFIGEQLPQLIVQICSLLVEFLPQIVESLTYVLTETLTGLLSALPVLLPQLVQLAQDVILMITELLPELVPLLVDALVQVTNILIEQLPVILPMLIDACLTIVLALTSALPEILKSLTSALPQILQAVWDTIVMIFKNLPSWFGQLFSSALQIIKSLWNISSVGQFFSNIWSSIKKAFGAVGSWFKDTFSKAWQAVKNVFSSGGKVFEGIKDGISNVFKTVVNAIIRGINKVIAVPFNAINSMLNKIRNVSIAGVQPFSGLIRTFSVPQIPELEYGAVLEKGQVGLLEGKGAEAVVPLERNKKWINKVAQEFLAQFRNVAGAGIMQSSAQSSFAAGFADLGVNAKLDKILAAIERGQVLMLDGDALVGATANRMDGALGLRRALAARGAL